MSGNGASQSRFRLLVVDDHVLFYEGLLELFRTAGMLEAAAGACRSAEALRLAKSLRPHVALIDVTLPDGYAFQTGRSILSRCPQTRLLFLDHAVRVPHLRAALEVGGSGYWTKHASFERIAEAVRQVAAGRPAFCPAVSKHLAVTSGGVRYEPLTESAPLAMLTPREVEVLTLLARGFSVRQCAEKLQLARSTVDNHKSRLMRRLKIHKTVDLVRMALREGLVAE